MIKEFIVSEIAFISENDLRIPSWCKTWGEPSNWRNFDRFVMDETQIGKLVNQMNGGKQYLYDLLAKPALPEFTIMIAPPVGDEDTLICYRKTVLSGSFEMSIRKGTSVKIEPIIDAYLHLNNHGSETDVIVTLCKGTSNSLNGEVSFIAQPVWARKGTSRLFDQDESNDQYFRQVYWMYLAIQDAMYNRPSVFRDTAQNGAANTAGKASNIEEKDRKRNRKHRPVRVMHIVSSELEKAPQNVAPDAHRVIQCPCWGVAGHWRNYKSGKRSWVRPYTKGAERSNTQYYQAKEYQLMEQSFM